MLGFSRLVPPNMRNTLRELPHPLKITTITPIHPSQRIKFTVTQVTRNMLETAKIKAALVKQILMITQP